jgi:hypothetical protein
MEALYFSLSTMTTIGYGVSDYYFSGCYTPFLLVVCQSCTAITFDAVAVGILFQRISRGHKRGKTILFSDKAVVRRVNGMLHLLFRVAELRHHHLLEATVRMYCVRHERHAATIDSELGSPSQDDSAASDTVLVETVHYVSRPMKLLHEQVGSHILMSLPQVVAHRIDESSPLSPLAASWYDAHGKRHTRGSVDLSTLELDEFLRDRAAEIVVLLEGTDELTGAVIQTRHSYSVDDLAWDKALAPCVFPTLCSDASRPVISDGALQATPRRHWLQRAPASAATCYVDFARFHDTMDAPSNCTSCPYIVE